MRPLESRCSPHTQGWNALPLPRPDTRSRALWVKSSKALYGSNAILPARNGCPCATEKCSEQKKALRRKVRQSCQTFRKPAAVPWCCLGLWLGRQFCSHSGQTDHGLECVRTPKSMKNAAATRRNPGKPRGTGEEDRPRPQGGRSQKRINMRAVHVNIFLF